MRKWSLYVLAFGTFGLGMAEFGMMSILSVAAAGLFGKEPTTYRGSCNVGSFAFLGKGCQRVIMLHWQKFTAYSMAKKCNDIFVVYIFAKYGYKNTYNRGRCMKSSPFS